MNYIQYMQSGGTTENKKETSKFIEWLNKAGKSWKDFWDKPVTVQYAYNPHAIVGNGGAPFSSTQRRGDFAAQAAGALAVPATAVGIATVGLPATAVGMGVGIGAGAAGAAGGSKLVELVGGDENSQEMVGDIAGFTLGAIAGGKATKATTNYLNLWNSLLSPKSIYTSMAEGLAPTTTQNYGLVKYYGPTMGKTTAARINPKLVDFDDIVRGPIAELAAKKGVTPRDLKIANDPDYISLLEAEVARWRMNPANADKTLVISNKALSSSTTGYNNLPSIPDKETFIARQVLRGGNREEAAAYYDALIENNPNLKIDNRFVSDIESGTRSAKISEAERLGIPKGERRQWLKGKTADAAYDSALGLGNNTYTQAVRNAHFKAKAPLGILNTSHSSLDDFTIFKPVKVEGRIEPFYHFGDNDGITAAWFHSLPNRNYKTKYYHLNLLNPLEVSDNTHFSVSELINEMHKKGYIDDIRREGLLNKYYRIGEDEPKEAAYQLLREFGNDGIKYFNDIEGSGSWSFAVPTNKQMKLSNAITYDDEGKIIPLSQRDNFLSKDPRYKSGGSIKIKKKNIGSFTRYCNGKVTEECIRKGKNSSNPTTRKRANFAWVARHKFKHEDGGKLNYLNYFK